MAAVRKVADIFYLLILTEFLIIVKGHNEPENFLGRSASESTESIGNNYRRDDDEGLAIELPSNQQTTTTTKKVLPPLHPRYRRIYNPDELATINDYNFMAAVLVNKELWCGAAIIHENRVITAAHCLQLQYNNRFFREYVKMLTVRVGSNNATEGGDIFKVVEISFHPNYKPSTLEFNVAVLRLHKNISGSSVDDSQPRANKIDYSKFITVPADSDITFLGWGSVLSSGGLGGTVLLQQVTLPVYDLADCQMVYGRELVTRYNFCAGFITKAKNVCNHDAGGPAILDGQLVGILSFSSKRCDVADQPAVFTSVGAVSPWLDELLTT